MSYLFVSRRRHRECNITPARLYRFPGDRERPEIDACLPTVVRTFEALSSASAAFSVWVSKANSFKAALRRDALSINDHTIWSQLPKGQTFNDCPPGDVTRDVGFGCSLWNKETEGISGTMTARVGSILPGVGNHLTLEAERVADGRSICADRLLKIFTSLIDLWRPVKGAVVGDFATQQAGDAADRLIKPELASFMQPDLGKMRWTLPYLGPALAGSGKLSVDEKLTRVIMI